MKKAAARPLFTWHAEKRAYLPVDFAGKEVSPALLPLVAVPPLPVPPEDEDVLEEPEAPDEPDMPDEPELPDESEVPVVPAVPGSGVMPLAEVPEPPVMPLSLPVPAPLEPVAFCDLICSDLLCGDLLLSTEVDEEDWAMAIDDTDATITNDRVLSAFSVMSAP